MVSSREATSIITSLVTRQHGVFGRWQAVAAGVSSGLIQSRVESGWLVPVFKGVYSPGTGLLDRDGRWHAAVLASGERSFLSRRSAAQLHGVIGPGSHAIEIVRSSGGKPLRRARASPDFGSFEVESHRSRSLPDSDVCVVGGIPVTSLARTLLDISSSFTVDRLKSVLSEAERLRLFSYDEMEVMLSRGRGWGGTRKLRLALAEWDPLEVETRTVLEVAMLRICREHGLPAPAVNAVVGSYQPDFLWMTERLIVETDGFGSHGTFASFKGDRRRDVDLKLAGFSVSRFSYEDVLRYGTETGHRLKGLLELSRRN